ncbi:MAG: hypothetical protein ACM3YM_03140 [Sphingomonadales bacterium]
MGLSSSKQKTTSSQTTNPVTPDWIAQPNQNYASAVGSFAAQEPHAFVAPASVLQQQAFAGAANLGAAQPAISDAISMAKTAAASPAPSYDAPTLGPAAQARITQWNAPSLGPAQQARISTYDAPNLRDAALVDPVTLAPAHEAQAASLLDNFNRYMDPTTQALVDTTLANYDASTGRQAAALAAQQARTGAFGGSRAGVAQGEFQASSGRDRAQTEAELRARAYSQAAQLAASDAANRQGVNLFNAGAANSRDLTQGQMNLARLTSNAGFMNDFALHQGDLAAQAAQFNANAQNQGSMFNAGQTNDLAKARANLAAQAAAANAAASNTASLANSAAQNQFATTQAGLAANAGQFNAQQQADAANRALQAAGLVGNLGVASGDQQRQDLMLTADLGAAQRAIEQAYLQAPLTQLQAEGQLYGMIPYSAFVGQQSNGTNVTKNSPSLFDQALAAGSTLASFIPK